MSYESSIFLAMPSIMQHNATESWNFLMAWISLVNRLGVLQTGSQSLTIIGILLSLFIILFYLFFYLLFYLFFVLCYFICYLERIQLLILCPLHNLSIHLHFQSHFPVNFQVIFYCPSKVIFGSPCQVIIGIQELDLNLFTITFLLITFSFDGLFF